MELAESLCYGSGRVQFLYQSFDFRADSQTLEHTSREFISGEVKLVSLVLVNQNLNSLAI